MCGIVQFIAQLTSQPGAFWTQEYTAASTSFKICLTELF